MKVYGDLDLKGHSLFDVILGGDGNFPTNPKPGQIIFKNKTLYLCAEIADGLPVWLPTSAEIDAIIHDQNENSTSWVINHNLNSSTVFVQVFDENNQAILPDSIDASSLNQITVNLLYPMKGRAVVMLGALSGKPKENIAFTQNFTELDTWVINHGLGYNPIIKVYVGNNEVQPFSITHDSTTQATVTFSSPQTGLVRCI